jgi:zinc protease
MFHKILKRSLSLLILSLLIACLTDNLQAMTAVRKTVLSNGLVILHSEDHSLPFVTLQLLVDGGSRKDPPGQEGLSYLTAKGLLLGTSRRTMAEISEELDFMGTSISSSSGRDYSTLGLRTLKENLDRSIEIFMEELTQPAFPDGEIKREVQKTLAAIQSEEDEPGEVAEKEFRKALFLSSPYAHPVVGSKESLPKITRESISSFYKDYYHPNNYILVVVGDITAEEAKTKLFPLFEKMTAAEIPQAPFVSSFAKGPETIKLNREITQANIVLGNEGINRGDPDFYAASVMNYILGGGGFASRMLEDIRNKRGLAYEVASFFDAAKYPGSFQVVLQTKNASAREAISLALKQMELIREEPVSDKELDGAKKYLIGSFPMRLDTQDKIANFLAQVQYYDLGLDYAEKYPALIKSVTKEDVLRVAKKYLKPKNYVLVVVANLKETGMGEASSNRDTSVPEQGVNMTDLGISVDDISPGLQKEYILEEAGGVVVTRVKPDSPADAAGIKAGDVIRKIDLNPISNMKDFDAAMLYWKKGRNIEFSIKRGKDMLDIIIATDSNHM